MNRWLQVTLIAVLGCAMALPSMAGPFDKWKKKAEEKAAKAAEQEVDKVLDEAIECVFDDLECIAEAEKNGQEVVLVDSDGKALEKPPAEAPAQAPPAAEAESSGEEPGEGVWRNYDFVPGRDVWRHIVVDDERVGRFPARQLEFVKGNMQVVDKDGKRVIEVSSDSVFRVNLDQDLPVGFTLEFLLQIGAPNVATRVYFAPLDTAHSRYPYHYLNLFHRCGIDFRGTTVSQQDGFRKLSEEMLPVRLQVDDTYAILYVGNERAANLPAANFPRGSVIEFHLGGNSNLRSYISDITVAVGLDRLYDALMDAGSFTTRGIFFDVDSARLRPESTPTLVEIEDVLSRHGDLRVRIEGHTDSTGDDAHNLELSSRRAQSVVDYLVAQGIDAKRLQPVGRGEAEAVADNATAAGRQQNRRVVIAKLEQPSELPAVENFRLE